MGFNSPFFLFAFLPITILIYTAAGSKLRNLILLLVSLFFYAWGQPLYIPVMLVLIWLNFSLGGSIEKAQNHPARALRLTILAATVNITMLVFFKAVVTYWPEWLEFVRSQLRIPLSPAWNIYLRQYAAYPLGLSFISFQAIAYQIDIYKKRGAAESHFGRFALYLLLFPKLIAGPIVRYRDIADQLHSREITLQASVEGTRRFIMGLAKKVLIADQLSLLVDRGVFNQGLPNISPAIAWLILICYTLQIYFDFSGYTDMAIGLGKIFGFQFVENFNYPYISKSISEFWRRWHISLSNWFRDYVFYPLERKRHNAKNLTQAGNILIVFLLTGLWHGLTWNFLIWGGLHGLAIALEAGGLGRRLKSLWPPLQYLYTLGIVMIGWVFFRSPTPAYALKYLGTLAGLHQGADALPFTMLPPLEASFWITLALGLLFALPIWPALQRLRANLTAQRPSLALPLETAGDVLLIGLLVLSLVVLAGSTAQPYIYGKF